MMADGRGSMASIAGDRLPWLDEVDAHVEIDLASARLARELRDSARQVIGLLPASAGTPVQAVARQLAIAVSRLTRKTVVILDPEATSVTKDDSAHAGDQVDGDASHALFALRRIDPLIIHSAPDHAAPPGAKAELLKLMLSHVDNNVAYGMIFVDMCGLVWPGELLAGLARLDGVIVVGHRGKTKEPEIVATAGRVPAHLAIGILLAE